MTGAQVQFAGESALLAQLAAAIDPDVNARAIAIAQALDAAAVPGVRDVVPTFHGVAVHVDPLRTDIDAVRDRLERAAVAPLRPREGRHVEVPVAYGGDDGPDLDAVAEYAGIPRDEVIRRHAGRPYRVFMLGFLPGFAYLGPVDARIAAPRRSTPRVRVPAGSVGIAGPQTGVYPMESPGGWQIIGRTGMPMFDATRTPAALVAPGDTVTFVRSDRGVPRDRMTNPPGSPGERERLAPRVDRSGGFSDPAARAVTVLRPGLFTTVQDAGRWGHQASGVPVSGAMDLIAHRIANAIVGNAPDAATLEITLVGPELRVEQDVTVAIAGGDLEPSLDGTAVPLDAPVRCRAGSVLRFGRRRAGARA